MTCCQIGARLPWMRCDRCTCRGCSEGDIPALVVLRARAAPHRGAVPVTAHPPPPLAPRLVVLSPGRASARIPGGGRRAYAAHHRGRGLSPRPCVAALLRPSSSAAMGPGHGSGQVCPGPGRPRGSVVGSAMGMRRRSLARPVRMAGPTVSLNLHLPKSPPLTLPPRPTPPGHTVPHGGAFGGG